MFEPILVYSEIWEGRGYNREILSQKQTKNNNRFLRGFSPVSLSAYTEASVTMTEKPKSSHSLQLRGWIGYSDHLRPQSPPSPTRHKKDSKMCVSQPFLSDAHTGNASE